MSKSESSYRVVAAYLAESLRDARRSVVPRRQPASNLRDRQRRVKPRPTGA